MNRLFGPSLDGPRLTLWSGSAQGDSDLLSGLRFHVNRRRLLSLSDQYRYQEVWEHAIKKLAALDAA